MTWMEEEEEEGEGKGEELFTAVEERKRCDTLKTPSACME